MVLAMKRDVDLQRDVIDELQYDPEIDAEDIGVTVDNGVVTLAGRITTFSQYSAADRAVHRIAGVRAFANDLKVAAFHGGMPDDLEVAALGGGTLNDTEIAKGIADAFDRNVVLSPGITIRVVDGGITLEGTVAWYYQRDAAEATARSTRGVRWVWNMITVTQPAVDAATIEEGITRALVRNATVDAQHVHVQVRGRHVTLTGEVHSLAERQEAAAATWRGTGVSEITNHLRVVPR